MGVVSPIGNSLTEFRAGLKGGMSGKAVIRSFDISNFPVQYACEVKNFEARVFGTHLLDPFIQYAVAAATEAFQNAYFETARYDPYRIGISVSSSKGGVHTIGRFKERFYKHPSAILGARIYANSVPNFAAQWIARRWKLQGPAKCYVAACATGTVSVIEGVRMVADGVVDYCVAGSSDASVTPLMMAGYHNMKVLARDEIRPFDKRRDGFLVGEGAGILFLESLESARKRGVKIYGEILGSSYGNHSSDLIKFDLHDDALSHAVGLLLKHAGLEAGDIDYINLHGTGTPTGDIYETAQLKKALGNRAYHIPMSSTKSMTGHMLGAAGAVEIISCLLAMEDDFIPPTIHLEKADPACDLDYTPLISRNCKIHTAVSVSMGFGGHIATIALRKV